MTLFKEEKEDMKTALPRIQVSASAVSPEGFAHFSIRAEDLRTRQSHSRIGP